MATMLFGNRIAPACRYCAYVRRKSTQEDTLLCAKKGEVSGENHCARFRYDPLKREPKIPLSFQQYDEEEFSL